MQRNVAHYHGPSVGRPCTDNHLAYNTAAATCADSYGISAAAAAAAAAACCLVLVPGTEIRDVASSCRWTEDSAPETLRDRSVATAMTLANCDSVPRCGTVMGTEYIHTARDNTSCRTSASVRRSMLYAVGDTDAPGSAVMLPRVLNKLLQ